MNTGGFTELLFGLFMLLGFRSAPRLRDLSDQTLYRPRKHTDYGVLTPVLKKDIREDLIVRHWDNMNRLAASLKDGVPLWCESHRGFLVKDGPGARFQIIPQNRTVFG